MRNIQEFEEEWKNAASEEGVTDFYVSMSGSWSEQHKKDFHYFNHHRFVNYEIIDQEKVKLIGDDGQTFVVFVAYISSII